ncbi:MAG: hypothetical protein JNK88_10670 [Mangrovicoccus sp.]|nr:hypothetical protein [Mangrovicoccus sp.]
MARQHWTSRGVTFRSGLRALAIVAAALAVAPVSAPASTLSIVSQLDAVNGPHPWSQANSTTNAAAGNGPAGSQPIRLVWGFQRFSKPTSQHIFGGWFETYHGGTVRVEALDGTPMFDLGSFTVVNFSEYDALGLASDTADGIFIFRDPDFATVTRQKLGALVAPLLVNSNTQLSEFFFHSTDDAVSRINAVVGDLVPAAEVPLPHPALLLCSVLGALGLRARLRRAA